MWAICILHYFSVIIQNYTEYFYHNTNETNNFLSIIMKNNFILAVSLLFALTLSAQIDESTVLMTVNGEPSTVGEFIYIYQKNNQEAQVDQKSIDEYVELFKNFKLKVAAAKEAGVDTTEAFRKELNGYRRQATPKYMTDSEIEEAVIQKAYGRMLNDRRVSHIAIRCADNETERTVAQLKMDTIRQRVTTGLKVTTGKGKNAKTKQLPPEDFNEVALEVSDDPSVTDNRGVVGYVRPFRFVYPFEEAAYNTPVGEVSEVFQTPFGLHILRVEEEIPHLEVQASHIMKMTPKGNDSIATVAKQQIDSIYQLLLAGADFQQTAVQNSDDRGSAMRGGDLGFFGRGQMVPEFENVAFSMTEPGEISEPFKSQYGWHIIKRGETRGTPELAEIREDVKKNINRSEYRQLVNKGFVDKLRKEYGVVDNTAAIETLKEAWKTAEDNDSLFKVNTADLYDVLCTINGKQFTQQDLVSYIMTNPFTANNSNNYIEEKYNMFVEKELRAVEDANLEKKYPDLRNLMAEYHDGIMLFEISLREVWDKASQDTAGITNFFKQNKKNYTWDSPRYKGYIIYAKDKKTAKAAKQIIKTANPDSVSSYINNRLNTDSVKSVRYERGIWKQGDNKAVDRLAFKNKKNGYTPSEQMPVEVIVGKKLKAPQEYSDERGKVTADYQDYLEKQWLERLKVKYPVVVNQEVLEVIKQK